MAEITWNNERRKLKDLQPWSRNPRQINKAQAARLAESFNEFGQVETIAIGPTNEVYNGHQRLGVLLAKYGGEHEVEVRVASEPLTEKQREKLTVYLHKGAAGEWDFDMLANEFELDDLLDWGFDKKELDIDLWADEPPEDVEPQIDKAEELREKWGVESGQLWQLGEHRLICGDCTDKSVVERVMQGEKADMVFTDPPYGMNLDTDYSPIMNRGNKYSEVIGDDKDFDFNAVNYFDCAEQFWWGADWYRKTIPDGGSWFVWDKQISDHDGLSHTGSLFELVWSKTSHKREIIKVPYFRFYGMDTKNRLHPTQKPEKLCVWFIEKFSKDGNTVVDLFIGSGTTLIACERLGRKCRAVEISPAYCAVAIQRWVDVTGKEPELIGS